MNKNDIGIKQLISLTEEDMAKVNSLIIQKTMSNTEIIPKISQYLISSGGKRLRPMLTIASSRLCNCDNEHYITLAASVEFMHTATLLHDDVVDDSRMRRGKISARMLWGNEASVLVGDYLLGEAFKMMVDARSLDALEVLSNAAAIIAEGEVMQLVYSNQLLLTKEQYFKIIDHKTAKLFSAAAEIGAIISNAPKEYAEQLRNFGQFLGIAFQLTDDALDYSLDSSDIGKDLGDDFYEGKITYPIIIAIEKAEAEERTKWEKLMQKKQRDENDFQFARDMLVTSGAIKETLIEAEKYAHKAIKCLDCFHDNEIKKAMIDGAHFSYNRDI